MKRGTTIFLLLLALATLSAGVLYQNSAALLAGHAMTWNWIGLFVSAPLLAFGLLVLGRILYLTAPEKGRGEVSR